MAWRCAAYFPGITLGVLSMLNVLLAHTGSSGAIPLLAFFSLISLWFIISIPLCFSGAPGALYLPCVCPQALLQRVLIPVICRAQQRAADPDCPRGSELCPARHAQASSPRDDHIDPHEGAGGAIMATWDSWEFWLHLASPGLPGSMSGAARCQGRPDGAPLKQAA